MDRPVDAEGGSLTAALAALWLGGLCPLGLASGEAADLAAGAFGVRHAFAEVTPLCDVFARLAVLVPIGELGTRPHLVAAVAGAVALGLLVACLRLAALPGAVVAAVVAGVALIGVCRPFLEVATVRPVRAIDFCLLVAIVLLLELVRRDPTRSRVGLGLALGCGLAAGASWWLRAVTWPTAVGLGVWALRRGERWPLVAPLVFLAGAGVVLGGVVSADPQSVRTVGLLLHGLVAPPVPTTLAAPTVVAALTTVADDVGVIPLLVAAVGSCVWFFRARADMIFSFLLWAAAITATLVEADILLARLVMIAALTGPVAVGVGFFAQSFGRARGAVGIVLAVIVMIPPALIGVGSALRAPGWRTPHAVARRLDAAVDLRESSTTIVTGVDREAARWRRYARAIGPGATGGW